MRVVVSLCNVRVVALQFACPSIRRRTHLHFVLHCRNTSQTAHTTANTGCFPEVCNLVVNIGLRIHDPCPEQCVLGLLGVNDIQTDCLMLAGDPLEHGGELRKGQSRLSELGTAGPRAVLAQEELAVPAPTPFHSDCMGTKVDEECDARICRLLLKKFADVSPLKLDVLFRIVLFKRVVVLVLLHRLWLPEHRGGYRGELGSSGTFLWRAESVALVVKGSHGDDCLHIVHNGPHLASLTLFAFFALPAPP